MNLFNRFQKILKVTKILKKLTLVICLSQFTFCEMAQANSELRRQLGNTVGDSSIELAQLGTVEALAIVNLLGATSMFYFAVGVPGGKRFHVKNLGNALNASLLSVIVVLSTYVLITSAKNEEATKALAVLLLVDSFFALKVAEQFLFEMRQMHYSDRDANYRPEEIVNEINALEELIVAGVAATNVSPPIGLETAEMRGEIIERAIEEVMEEVKREVGSAGTEEEEEIKVNALANGNGNGNGKEMTDMVLYGQALSDIEAPALNLRKRRFIPDRKLSAIHSAVGLVNRLTQKVMGSDKYFIQLENRLPSGELSTVLKGFSNTALEDLYYADPEVKQSVERMANLVKLSQTSFDQLIATKRGIAKEQKLATRLYKYFLLRMLNENGLIERLRQNDQEKKLASCAEKFIPKFCKGSGIGEAQANQIIRKNLVKNIPRIRKGLTALLGGISFACAILGGNSIATGIEGFLNAHPGNGTFVNGTAGGF